LTSLQARSDYQLWAFDARGRAIDPGAVAAWWTYLASTAFVDTNSSSLWASGANFPSGTKATCAVDARRTVHLVNAHEGPLAAPLVDGRLTITSADSGSGVVRSAAGTSALGFSFAPVPTDPATTSAADPALDNAPLPRLALLPSGLSPGLAYGDSLQLWPSG